MLKLSKPLGEILGKGAIANGIQTSANKYYIHKETKSDSNYVFFKYKGKEYSVEKALTRPYFATRNPSIRIKVICFIYAR
jgi:hypothetical protein